MYVVIIGIQKGLDSLKEQLEKRGYYVVEAEQFQHGVDVYIYRGIQAEGVLENFSVTKQAPMAGIRDSSSLGVLMINAYNKTIDEIEEILQNRVYTSLF